MSQPLTKADLTAALATMEKRLIKKIAGLDTKITGIEMRLD